jgi:very-short-patch-repair endonuclease
MKIIVYGNEPPQISFKQSPSGSINFEFENEKVIYLDPGDGDIIGREADDVDVLWRDVYLSLLHNRGLVDLELDHTEGSLWYGSFESLISNDLAPLIATESEKRFFDFYLELLSLEYSDMWDAPALVPQVWVNWIHYDPKSRDRAERVQQEAFRVDFMLRVRDAGGFIAIEIDGSSHFGGRSFVSNSGAVMFEASMEAYTKHLRKDRWLRKQGWKVIRISNSEIDEIENVAQFKALLADLLDLRSLDCIRFKQPWE